MVTLMDSGYFDEINKGPLKLKHRGGFSCIFSKLSGIISPQSYPWGFVLGQINLKNEVNLNCNLCTILALPIEYHKKFRDSQL